MDCSKKNNFSFDRELCRSRLGDLLFWAYRFPILRKLCIHLSTKLEGGHYYSSTLRQIFDYYHKIEIGAYSYGGCFVADAFPSGTKIGRYVSIATGIRAFTRNHPDSWLSMHPFFFNRLLGFVPHDFVPSGSLVIGDDSWIGDRVIITPGCSRIGIGAVIGAGAVVTKDVPNFAVVAGNPARLIRFRFSEEIQKIILDSCWWDLPVSKCVEHLSEVTKPLVQASDHPLLRAAAAEKDRA